MSTVKYRLTIAAALIVITFLSGCLGGGEEEQTGSRISARPELAKCNSIPDPFEREDCYTQVAQDLKDASICEQDVTFTDNKKACYSALAIATGDTALCENLKDDKWRYKICMGGE